LLPRAIYAIHSIATQRAVQPVTLSHDHIIPALFRDTVLALFRDIVPALFRDIIPALFRDIVPAFFRDIIPASRAEAAGAPAALAGRVREGVHRLTAGSYAPVPFDLPAPERCPEGLLLRWWRRTQRREDRGAAQAQRPHRRLERAN